MENHTIRVTNCNRDHRIHLECTCGWDKPLEVRPTVEAVAVAVVVHRQELSAELPQPVTRFSEIVDGGQFSDQQGSAYLKISPVEDHGNRYNAVAIKSGMPEKFSEIEGVTPAANGSAESIEAKIRPDAA